MYKYNYDNRIHKKGSNDLQWNYYYCQYFCLLYFENMYVFLFIGKLKLIYIRCMYLVTLNFVVIIE